MNDLFNEGQNFATDILLTIATLAWTLHQRGPINVGTKRKEILTGLTYELLNKLESVFVYDSSEKRLFFWLQTEKNKSAILLSSMH